MNFDLIIRGGVVFDGLGGDPCTTDVGIMGNRIHAINNLQHASARKTIDAAGCYVAPGFIDVHSHSDAYVLIEPSAASKLHQGITTEIVGQCGASASPLHGDYKMPSDWREMEYPGRWSSLPEYTALLNSQSPALNIATLTGHNTLRAGVMGYEPRRATHHEMDLMKERLAECMASGSRGFSTGLLYPPGKHASLEEVIELCRVAAAHNGVYATHMRSEGDELLESLEETINIARQSGVRLQISHLKTSGASNWHKLERAFELIENAQAEGLTICADRYPYTAACTDLDVLLPDWVFAEGPARELEWLTDTSTRQRIREQTIASRTNDYWQTVHVGSTWHPDTLAFAGKPLIDVAKSLDMHPVDAVLHLLILDRVKTGGIFFGMNEENLWKILARPYVMPGSDASLRALTGPLSHDHPHPRAYGSFAKYFRAALKGETIPLAEAIRKATSLPAQHFNLSKRGILREQNFADLVVFSPDFTDHTTYEKPHALATGMHAVIVNGVLTLQDDKPTQKRSGHFLS